MNRDLSLGRWGCNRQPFRRTVEAVLQTLPVADAEAVGNRLALQLLRPLTGAEAWRLAMTLRPDGPETIGERHTRLVLWWD